MKEELKIIAGLLNNLKAVVKGNYNKERVVEEIEEIKKRVNTLRGEI